METSGRLDRSIEYALVGDGQSARRLEAHALLRETLGAGHVEDVASFLESVSSRMRPGVVPKLLTATSRRRVVAAVVGAYLRDLDAGMVLYSGVRPAFRGRGIYTRLKARLIAELSREAALGPCLPGGRRTAIGYLVSELDEGSWLFRKYVVEWRAWVAPFDYEQPATQGLAARKLKLVVQPVADLTPPTGVEALDIVRVLYDQIYRLPDALESTHFRRIVRSLRASVRPTGTAIVVR